MIFDWDSQPKVAPEPLSEGGKGLHSVGGYTADGQYEWPTAIGTSNRHSLNSSLLLLVMMCDATNRAERDVIAWTKTKGDEDQQSKVSNATVIPSSSAHDLLVWNDTSKPAVDEIKVTPAKADSRQQYASRCGTITTPRAHRGADQRRTGPRRWTSLRGAIRRP